jgi:carboxylesterase type B
VFGNLGSDQVLQAPAHDATDAAVSAAMMKAWVAFATKGKPQGEGGPEWPAYDANTERHLEFGDRVTIGRGWRTDPLDFLESFYRRRAGR